MTEETADRSENQNRTIIVGLSEVEYFLMTRI